MSAPSSVSPNTFVNFKTVKESVNILQVIERYGLLPNLKRSGDRLSGPCPIHQGTNATQFRVSISKNCFNCFGNCGRGGNVIDFVSLMEGVPFRDAALLLQEWFMPEEGRATRVAETGASKLQAKPASRVKPRSKRNPSPNAAKQSEDDDGGSTDAEEESEDETGENPPLTFELNSLKPDHPYFDERGLTPETVEHFGLGYCSRGCLRGHVAIPIHNRNGDLVAYAGRWPGDPPEDCSKYKLPKGFKKSLVLFNLHRALQEQDDLPLVIVEGFFDCLSMWQAGIRRCVALMGSSLSDAQEQLIAGSLPRGARVEILFDEDDAGRKGRDEAVNRLARHAFVHVIALPEEGLQPDHLDADELASLFE